VQRERKACAIQQVRAVMAQRRAVVAVRNLWRKGAAREAENGTCGERELIACNVALRMRA